MADITRRGLLRGGAAVLGCSAAAFPLTTTVTMASAPWDERLVVLILRGAMDGLDVVRPVGDPHFAPARAGLFDAAAPGLPLDGFFTLHPSLKPLHPLWGKGELGVVHAVSTPYRDKRSHFDGQDLLEAGTGMDVSRLAARDGWLNRMLQTVGGLEGQTAFAIGRDEMKVLRGKAPVMNWSPDVTLDITPQTRLLLEHVYHEDPLFRDTALEAIELAELAEPDTSTERGAALNARLQEGRSSSMNDLAAFAADRLYHDTRIAAFSVPGWDHHRGQAKVMPQRLELLAEVIETLRIGLGDAWSKTTVLAMTEFGRTLRENGTKGTDHGTGGAMLMAGGAIRGGRVLGRWPGLSESELYDRRDLMPTGDVRAYAAWAMRGLFGLERGVLERSVFPGLDMGSDPGLLL